MDGKPKVLYVDNINMHVKYVETHCDSTDHAHIIIKPLPYSMAQLLEVITTWI